MGVPFGLVALLGVMAGCTPATTSTPTVTSTFLADPNAGGHQLAVAWQTEQVVTWAPNAYVVMYPGNDTGIYPRTAAVGTLDIHFTLPQGAPFEKAQVVLTPHQGAHDKLVMGIDPDTPVRVGKLCTGTYDVSLWRKDPNWVATPSIVEVDGKTIQSVVLGPDR